jgi:hypothetical protein
MAPGIAMTVVFVDRVTAAITDPGIGTLAMLAAFTGVVIGVALYAHRRFAAPNAQQRGTDGA